MLNKREKEANYDFDWPLVENSISSKEHEILNQSVEILVGIVEDLEELASQKEVSDKFKSKHELN